MSQPFICACCEEHRDAKDSPPSERPNFSGLVCFECCEEIDAEDVIAMRDQMSMGEPVGWGPER